MIMMYYLVVWNLMTTSSTQLNNYLVCQFPSIQGFSGTQKPKILNAWTDNYIQILHSRTNHWITISTIGCKSGEVCVYDSLYSDTDNTCFIKFINNYLGI
uniref:Ubiquitin-like protease family profile domain-containing protein n=1 Tax=Amphimedon queenslandica TaxID=400682 RepID=A0A1X7UR07_AMPQE